MSTSAESETGRINLRDVPVPVIQHYKARAKAQGESLNTFLVKHLVEAMAGEKSEWQRFLDTHTRADIPQDDGEAAFVALDYARKVFGRFEDDPV